MLTGLEVRILAYGLLALALVGGASLETWRLTSSHYQALMTADKAAEQQAVLTQQQKVIAAQTSQQAASEAAQRQVEDAKASAVILGDQFSGVLRQYTSLYRRIVSTPATTSSRPDVSPEESAGDPGLAGVAGQAVAACEADAAQLAAFQTWAKSVSQPQGVP